MNSAATVDPKAAGSQIDALYRGASTRHPSTGARDKLSVRRPLL